MTTTATKKRKKITGRKLTLLLLAVPFVIYMIIFCYIPLAGWALAFMDYKPGIPFGQTPFVGLDNFMYIFEFGADIGNALKNTLVMFGLGFITSPLPVVFAILLTELPSRKFQRFVQTVTTIPNFISWVIVFSLAFAMFSTYGAVNTAFTTLGISDQPVNVLSNPDIVWYFQCALGIWKGLGWSSIVYFAAITGIDTELYDAATVDGANRFQRIWHITVPSVSETFIVLLLLSVCNFLSSGLDQYLVFYNPLVAEKIEVLDYFIYRIGLLQADYSFGTAIGILKSAISIGMLFGVNALAKKIRGTSIV
ncbi:MAG TPA: sugar ABC transporter permease [Candidatus Merdivicinus excrementipullorum]|uniref:Sugar ABC transporter permease n=1 Tax=Candidatus Merdivicinus excrementipullorum TaxID=2840867 RepID=A0A9D1K1D1_9FIRM|nr:sugar ABC transporter permease [Candidatus Merdivicinus excrementipullorum]